MNGIETLRRIRTTERTRALRIGVKSCVGKRMDFAEFTRVTAQLGVDWLDERPMAMTPLGD